MNLDHLVKKDNQREDVRSWEVKTSVSYSVNVIVNGYGIGRTIPLDDGSGCFGATEAEVLAIAKKAKSKGFEVRVTKLEQTVTRIL